MNNSVLNLFFLKTVMFAKSGELLTLRLRKMAFQAILRQVSQSISSYLCCFKHCCERIATD